MELLSITPFAHVTLFAFLAMVGIWVCLIIGDVVWSWIDEKAQFEFNMVDRFVRYFAPVDEHITVKNYACRTGACDNYLKEKGYKKSVSHDEISEEHVKEIAKRFPYNVKSVKRVVVSWKLIAVFLGPLVAWFVLSFWALSLMVGGLVGLMFLARQVRRLCKRVAAHIEDPDAHKGGRS
jgi:uncharacterized membrane protein YraQ (UPF0718 family)